jgi:hypothetical protein
MPIQEFAVPSCAGHRSSISTESCPHLSCEQLIVERLGLSESCVFTLTDPIREGDDLATSSIIEKYV